MAKLKDPDPQAFKFTREGLNILDEIARDLGAVPRRAALEIVLRFAKRVKDTKGASYTDVLIEGEIPWKTIDRRRKAL